MEKFDFAEKASNKLPHLLAERRKQMKFKEDEELEASKQEKKFPTITIENEDNERRLLLKSDYETASEFNPDFHSDNEPPSDKLKEERLISKKKKFRIYKKIIKAGKKREMPSKYNKIEFKSKKTNFENLEENCLEDEKFQKLQMGIDEELTEIKLLSLQNMKRGELSSFRIEIIEYDKEKHQRNLVNQFFFQIFVKDWETIIDIYGDFKCMKTMIKRGNGIERLGKADQAQLSIFLKNEKTGEKIFEKKFGENEHIFDNTPSSIQELVINMKHGEMCRIDIRKDFFEEFEDDPEFLSKMLEAYTDSEERSYCIRAILHLTKLIKIDDLFCDGSVLKKTIMGSYSTAQPDLHSRIYYDYRIIKNSGEILYDGLKNQLQAIPQNDDHFKLYEDSTCEKNFLDDYSLSEAMRKALRNGKKLEKFELVIKDLEHFKEGKDREIVENSLKEGEKVEDFLPLKFEVKVYTFSVGDNAYTMGILDKKACFKDRKPVLVRLLRSKRYDRSLKILKFLKDILENVNLFF